MSRKFVYGNFKQNLLRADVARAAAGLAAGLTSRSLGGVKVGIAPSFLALDAAAGAFEGAPVDLLAQDCAAQDSGAFTGEVGPAMLAEAGVVGAIVGHSERRALFGEGNEQVAAKVKSVLGAGLRAIVCVGEPLEVREAGDHEKVVVSQVCAALAEVSPDLPADALIVAYEPVWAIGTGKTASPEQARDMHRRIRQALKELHGEAFADRSVIYGGSVKPANAADLLAAGEIDGFLVGGASLKPETFLPIIDAAIAASS